MGEGVWTPHVMQAPIDMPLVPFLCRPDHNRKGEPTMKPAAQQALDKMIK